MLWPSLQAKEGTMQGTNSSNFAADPGRVRDLARDIADKKLSPIALVQRYLDRIAAAERT